ncbi:MAG TPA: histidinol dehydrogenase [Candidatus Binatia bacterium]|nr:histidinol dehydrogenase [Candidatus Binatia bacterium]
MRLRILEADDAASLAGLYAGGWDPPQDVREGVAAIIAAVRGRGDQALVEYTQRFDHPNAPVERLRVPVPALADAEALIPAEIAAGLRLARKRVGEFHERQRPANVMVTDADGTVNALLYQPLEAVGAYVPGGSATLPSTVIMTVTPAKLAGVPRVVVTTPTGRDGKINAAILFACSLCGVDELYAVGGAQAIAALAYGTATIAPVDKIVGPGNVWVTEAKRQVFGRCGIDGLAGPSEVLVVADATAKPRLVAGEMLAQAEHDPLARVAAVSTERPLLEEIAALLDGDFARETGRTEVVESVLTRHAYLIHARSRADVIEVIERFAPEHLSLQVQDPWDIVPSIRNVGAIFVGDDTPVAAGDYIAGSNHVLPTSGASRFSSGLRTADFYRTTALVENSRARMHGDREVLAALAAFEGLPAHARTALMRE